MTAVARGALVSVFVAAIGLVAVHLEVEQTRCGVRIQELLRTRDASLERIRRLEIRYNRMISPDVLQRRLAEDFGPREELAGDPGLRP